MSKIIVYEHFWHGGWEREFSEDTPDLERAIDNEASSCIVESGWWKLYAEPDFSGDSVVLGPGDYLDSSAMGLRNDTLSSLKPVTIDVDSDASHIAINSRDELYISFSPKMRPPSETDLSKPRVSAIDRSGKITEVDGISSLPDSDVKDNFNPKGIAFDSNDNLFISDFQTRSIYRKAKVDGRISAILGSAAGEGASGLSAPTGVVCDSRDNLYIANKGTGKILKWTDDGASEFANGYTDISIIDIDNDGTLYIGDMYCIYKGTREPNGAIEFNVFAGKEKSLHAGNDANGDGGKATDAKFINFSDIAIDSQGNVYIAEEGGNRIRKVDVATNIISTVVGDGHVEAIGEPNAIAFDSKDNLYALVTTDGTKSINCFKLN